MKSLSHTTGSITLPAEAGEEKMVVELARRWGADAIRDSDGTELSQEMLNLGLEVYSTICLVRAEQTYPRRHMDQLPQKFLMSDPVTATSSTLLINPTSGFFGRNTSLIPATARRSPGRSLTAPPVKSFLRGNGASSQRRAR